MPTHPKILIVDDEPRMCDSLGLLLGGQNYEIWKANSGQEALSQLSKDDFDVVLLDIVMPDMNGHRVMDHINARNIDTSVIIITGDATLDSAVGALKRGAYDYLRKPFEYDELLKTVQNAISQRRLKKECESVEGKWAESEERYKYLVQNSPDIIYTLDPQGNFTFLSNAVERLLGYHAKDLIGKAYTKIIFEEDLEKSRWCFSERRTGARATSGSEVRLKLSDETHEFMDGENGCLTVELKSTGMYDKPTTEKNKKFFGTHGVARDISKRKRLEAQLQHAQRMESLGTMAGGIAHDFNNLLMGIQGNASLMLLGMDSSHIHYQRLKNIEQYVQNGAELTRQLLAFARGGKYEVRSTNVNELIEASSEMFGRTKKEIRIRRELKRNLWKVDADRGQIEQVLLNLYLNAWHAMPGGGELYLKTDNVKLKKDFVRPYDAGPGNYVKISVMDTGTGMDEATQARVFEPFFSTKEMGRGTGLGLASAYGIIKNHGGIVTVQSKKGAGTRFDIYLPACEKEETAAKQLPEKLLKGKESILLVDDEEMILEVGKEILMALGYTVLIAKGGKEAVEIYSKRQGAIEMVILDMIMPDMSGGETFNRMRKINPNVKVLLSSGYSIDGQAAEILKRGCDGFIQKPFNLKQLSWKIRDILDKCHS